MSGINSVNFSCPSCGNSNTRPALLQANPPGADAFQAMLSGSGEKSGGCSGKGGGKGETGDVSNISDLISQLVDAIVNALSQSLTDKLGGVGQAGEGEQANTNVLGQNQSNSSCGSCG